MYNKTLRKIPVSTINMRTFAITLQFGALIIYTTLAMHRSCWAWSCYALHIIMLCMYTYIQIGICFWLGFWLVSRGQGSISTAFRAFSNRGLSLNSTLPPPHSFTFHQFTFRCCVVCVALFVLSVFLLCFRRCFIVCL